MPPDAKPRWWIAPLRAGFLAATLVAAAMLVLREREAIADALERVTLSDLALGFAFAASHIFASFLAWRALLARQVIGHRLAARMFFLGQIGKYLPGGVWPFLAAAELGLDAGMARRTTLASFGVAILISLAAGAALALVTLPQAFGILHIQPVWMVVALLPALLLLHPAPMLWAARIAHIDFTPAPTRLVIAFLFSLLTWVMAGMHLFFLARGLGVALEGSAMLILAGIYALAWLTGFVVMIAPAGLGAREATMIALLTTVMPVAEATVVALLSRVLMTLTDFAAAGVTLLLSRARGAPATP